MLQSNFKEDFFRVWAPNNFYPWRLWDHLLAIFVIFAVLGTLKLLKILTSLRACSDLYAHAELTGQDLMRALSMRIRDWCPPWPYASVSYAHTQHVHQFSNFSDVYFVYPKHARKELMRALSMRLRNWCIRWSYASGTGAGTEQFRVQWFWLFFTFWGITNHPWHPKGPRIWKWAKKNFQLHPWPAEIFGKNRKMRFFGLVSKFDFRSPVWQILTIFSACFIYGSLNTHTKC
jgi:hypothetical protein